MSSHTSSMSRRNSLYFMGTTAIATVAGSSLSSRAAGETVAPVSRKGRIRQGITRGVLRGIKDFDEMCRICARLGVQGIDFVPPQDWPTLKKHGLVCCITQCGSLAKGLNNKENHAALIETLRENITITAAAGYPAVICFSGNRNGISEEEGLENCALALKQIVPLAEEKRINLCMELLNSKRNHKDYQCDHTAWGVELCKRVGSERFKLLYDIYHMQIMEGDIIATIRENIGYIAHIHTAGCPGRNEIDDTQELYYPAIMRAIVDTGYKGYVSHEYGPKRDPVTSLEQALEICDV